MFTRSALRSRGAALLAAALSILAMCAQTGCASVTPPPRAVEHATVRIDDAAERALVRANGGAGRLLVLNEGQPQAATVVTIHGINAGPEALERIHDSAARSGARLLTFAYDDQRRRLTESARDLAGALAADRRLHPEGKMVVYAHSQGARVAVAAFDLLELDPAVGRAPVELHLLAPALGGFVAANLAGVAPAVFERAVPGVAPGVDMGTRSRFQGSLERAKLASNIRTWVYLGDQDRVIDGRSERLHRIAARIGAKVVEIRGADHDSIVDRVALGGPAKSPVARGSAVLAGGRARSTFSPRRRAGTPSDRRIPSAGARSERSSRDGGAEPDVCGA